MIKRVDGAVKGENKTWLQLQILFDSIEIDAIQYDVVMQSDRNDYVDIYLAGGFTCMDKRNCVPVIQWWNWKIVIFLCFLWSDNDVKIDFYRTISQSISPSDRPFILFSFSVFWFTLIEKNSNLSEKKNLHDLEVFDWSRNYFKLNLFLKEINAMNQC